MAVARWLVLLLFVSAAWAAAAAREKWGPGGAVGGQVVEKERRRVVAASEAGTVTSADVADAAGTVFQLQFITMEPGSLFLPVQLHADMVFYVQSGRGKVTYVEDGGSNTSSLEVQRGDVYNFEQGTVLYIQSYPNSTRERLRIYAIFTSKGINADDPSHPTSEAYSNVSELLKGFEVEILRLGFGVPREVVEAIKSTKSPPSIITYNPKEDKDESNWTDEMFDTLWGIREPEFLNKKKKKDKEKHKHKDKKSKTKTFNFFSGKPDVENCYGWSRSMTNEDLQTLEGSNIGMFMVNLTTGSMMGPHWNPKATEIAVVTYGSGIVQVVCPSSSSGESQRGDRRHHGESQRGDRHRHGESQRGGRHYHGEGGDQEHGEIKCKNSVFRVKEGDVFVVPRFHPMAQISFNNGSFVFVGFSTHMGQNHPQFLAGKQSVLNVIGKDILALSLGQRNSSAVEKLLSAQRGSTIMACVSCAEELERRAEQEEQRGGKGRREREEEERRREEEERRRREQEERKREQEEERGRREEEERRRKEQEEREREQEEEEEERARREQEEEERRRREEEEGGGGGDEPEPRRREEEEEEGGRGVDDPRREEEEGGDWDEPPYRTSKSMKKHYRGRKRGVFRSA